MNELVVAAQNNDVENLRRLVDLEKAQHAAELDSVNKSTQVMQDACHEAARYNHAAALKLLLDAGCWIDIGEHVNFLSFSHRAN
jgi:hypothetical protein